MENNLSKQLERINNALANGALEVEFSDRKIRYRSLDEMLKIKNMLEKEIRGQSKTFEDRFINVIGSKGL